MSRRAVALGTLFALLLALPSAATAAVDRAAKPKNAQVVGYFIEWGIYGRNYQPKNLVTSGSAGKITHIKFAFGNVANGQCTIADSYADYDKFYDAASSVDGTSSRPTETERICS